MAAPVSSPLMPVSAAEAEHMLPRSSSPAASSRSAPSSASARVPARQSVRRTVFAASGASENFIFALTSGAESQPGRAAPPTLSSASSLRATQSHFSGREPRRQRRSISAFPSRSAKMPSFQKAIWFT